MELIERTEFLAALETRFEHVEESEGHCILICGEAGIGKTSLVKAFCKTRKNDCRIYQGTCDALFTPRPLAPLYDIMGQMGADIQEKDNHIADRVALFARVFQELSKEKYPTLVVFEDIHWADEATLDFIKYLARRISHLHCLFILTYRDDELHSQHQIRDVLGHVPTDSLTRIHLTPLSREAVEKLAGEKGYCGEDVYGITAGNPFYVNEILASYSPGVPDNIKDSIISVYNRMNEKTRQVWQILSILPTGFETKYLEKMEPLYATALENCLESKILILKEERIRFKHELYRRTIENSLSPFLRVALNKRILELFRESLEMDHQIERIIHHAKMANENELVVYYTPLAARRAEAMGAHTEASKLYYTAIEYYQGKDKDRLIQFYESYAYECYLTNQIKEAIIYQEKSLIIWKEKNNAEKIGDCMRFLSRLWWFEANRKQAENYGIQAIEVLDNLPSSRAKAMGFSNMSQLKMLSGQSEECIFWGEKAITMAKALGDDEILSHALNNVGTVQMRIESSRQTGVKLLQESLDIALEKSYDEHVARAYTNLGVVRVETKEYELARISFRAGIEYCEERNLDSWTTYILSYQARLELETGNWNEAYRIADNLIRNERQNPIVKIGALIIAATIKMRRGDADILHLLLEAKSKAFETEEWQRIFPALIALLEYEWITGKVVIEKADLDCAIAMIGHTGNVYENQEFSFWLLKSRKLHLPNTGSAIVRTTEKRQKSGCPYKEALVLYEGNEADKRRAVSTLHKLGAIPVSEKMKQEMRNSGIKSIPRGIRESTRSNSALLTQRELDVLELLKESMQNKEIAARLFISPKTVEHHISSILFKLDTTSRLKAVQEAIRKKIII